MTLRFLTYSIHFLNHKYNYVFNVNIPILANTTLRNYNDICFPYYHPIFSVVSLESQVGLLQTAHYWANAAKVGGLGPTFSPNGISIANGVHISNLVG